MRSDVKPSLRRVTVPVLLTASAIAGVVLLSGCVGVRTEGEKRVRKEQESVGQIYRPGGERAAA